MTERGLIFKIVKAVESSFGGICWAFKDGKWWSVCIDNYDLYMKDAKFRMFTNNWRIVAKKHNIQVVFFYRNPVEKNLIELANQENLIMDV